MRTFLFFLCCLCFLLPSRASAHDTGASTEQVVGSTLVDIGYDVPQATAGEPVSFDFELSKPDRSADIPFSDVWVKISDGTTIILATGVHHATLGKTSLLFAFPHAGTYTFSVRYQNDSSALAEYEFPYTVTAPSTTTLTQPTASVKSFVGGVFLGTGTILITLVASSQMSKKQRNLAKSVTTK